MDDVILLMWVTVFVGLGIALAVNVKAAESRNMSNVYSLNRSQKRSFMFYYVLLHFTCILLPLFRCTVYLFFLVWNSSDAKDQFIRESKSDFILCIYK